MVKMAATTMVLLAAAAVMVDLALAARVTALLVGLHEEAPLVIRGVDDSDPPSGFLPDLLAEISALKNRRFQYRWFSDMPSALTFLDTRVNWQEAGLSRVRLGDLHLMATALPVVPAERLEHVKYSRPFMNTGIGAIFQKPRYMWSTEIDLGFLFRPFPLEIWIYFMLTYIGLGACMVLLHMFHPLEGGHASQSTRRDGKEFRPKDSFWVISTICVLQGFDRTPRSNAGKMLLVIWGLFVVVSVILYAVSMAMHFRPRGRSKEYMYKNIETFIDTDDVEMGYIANGTAQVFFANSTRYRHLVQRGKPVATLKEGMDRVRQGNFLFFIESPFINFELSRDCHLTQVGTYLNTRGYGFVYPTRENGFKDVIDEALQVLGETGRLAALQDFWFPDTECGSRPSHAHAGSGGTETSVSAKDYLSVIYVVIMGLILTAMLAASEVLLSKTRHKKRKKKGDLMATEECADVKDPDDHVVMTGSAASPGTDRLELDDNKGK